jgi:hypothetical protein
MSTQKIRIQHVKITYIDKTEVQYQNVLSVGVHRDPQNYTMKMEQDGKVYWIIVPYVNIREIIEEWSDES